MSHPPVRRRVTLEAIAAEAGVSLSTISKVLNGRPDVAASTRALVERQLAEHGYHRRRQSTTSPPLLELVVHELDAGYLMEIIRGVQTVARDNHLGLVLTESGTRHSPGPEWIGGVLQRRPRGVIMVFADAPQDVRAQLASREIPYVVIDPTGEPSGDVPSVGSANWAGGLMATRHLLELGHTRIAAISGPAEVICSRARVDGFRSAMGMAGVPVDENLVLWGDFQMNGGRENAAMLLDSSHPPTAIFACSDMQAIGVYDAARERGLRVPQDLSVVGYDDVPLASWVSPPLTTVHQPLRKMGETAAHLVLAAASGRHVGVPRMDLATELVVRGSTAAPASAQ